MTLAKIGQRLGRKALEEVAQIMRPETILAWRPGAPIGSVSLPQYSLASFRGRGQAVVFENVTHRLAADGEPQILQRALYSLVAPGPIVPGQLHHQLFHTDQSRRGRPRVDRCLEPSNFLATYGSSLPLLDNKEILCSIQISWFLCRKFLPLY